MCVSSSIARIEIRCLAFTAASIPALIAFGDGYISADLPTTPDSLIIDFLLTLPQYCLIQISVLVSDRWEKIYAYSIRIWG
jgi:hypothetical protein